MSYVKKFVTKADGFMVDKELDAWEEQVDEEIRQYLKAHAGDEFDEPLDLQGN